MTICSRYGFTPLPKYMRKEEFEDRVFSSSLSDDLKQLARSWYKLDENNIPFKIYILRNLEPQESDAFDNDVTPKLLQLLDGVSFDMDYNNLLVNRSITEYELKLALSKEYDEKRVFWLYRKFDGGITQSDHNYSNFDDTLCSEDKKRSYENLIKYMYDTIPSNNIHTYNKCSYSSFLNKDNEWVEQFKNWKADAYRILSTSLNNVIDNCRAWNKDGGGAGTVLLSNSFISIHLTHLVYSGMPGSELQEILHHCYWAYEKTRSYVGCTDIVQQAMEILLSKKRKRLVSNKHPFSKIKLHIVGHSGMFTYSFSYHNLIIIIIWFIY